MPVAMSLQTMVSYGIGVVIAGGKDVDDVIRDELHRFTVSIKDPKSLTKK